MSPARSDRLGTASCHTWLPALTPKCCYRRSNRTKHGGRLPRLQSIRIRYLQAVLWVPPTAPESGAEQRAGTTAVATLTAAQNGTYGPVVIAGRGSVGCGSPLLSCVHNGHVVCVCGQSSQINQVATEDGATGLGHGDDECIDGRSPLRRSAQDASSASKVLGDVLGDVADSQEPVRDGVMLRPTAEALDEDHRGNHWWPDAVTREGRNHGGGVLVPSCQSGHASGVEDEVGHEARLPAWERRTCWATASALARAVSSGAPTSATSSST